MTDKIKVGIMGATGLVGQEFVRLLKDHPFFKIEFLTASEVSSGKAYKDAVKWMLDETIPQEVENMTVIKTQVDEILKTGVKVIFSALPSRIALQIERDLRNSGYYIFSNSSAYRMNPEVPVLIPEVNYEHIRLIEVQRERYRGFIVTNSNCAVSGLVMALKPLYDEFGIEEVTVSTYQSISGAGLGGLYAMDISGNLIPFIEGEEEKIEQETRKILGRLSDSKVKQIPLKINASCCRVPVRRGHLESVVVKLKKEADLITIKEILQSFKGVPQNLKLPTAPDNPLVVLEERDRPQPVLDIFTGSPQRAKGMAVTIGRLRGEKKVFKFFLLANNTVRGAAGASVLNAELAYAEGIFNSNGGSHG